MKNELDNYTNPCSSIDVYIAAMLHSAIASGKISMPKDFTTSEKEEAVLNRIIELAHRTAWKKTQNFQEECDSI